MRGVVVVPTAGPPAQGVRLPYAALPASVHTWVDALLGSPVVAAETRPGGFSPGVAAVVRCTDGRRAFVKAVSAAVNVDSPKLHRKEAAAAAALPAEAPCPRLLGVYDDETLVALVFDHVEGRQPLLPWRPDELALVLAMLVRLSDTLTPSPWPEAPTLARRMGRAFTGWRQLADSDTDGDTDTDHDAVASLDGWSRRHLTDLAGLEGGWEQASAGETLLHIDVRADNLLVDGARVWLVDWPAASVGAAWVDVAMFAPSVTMQGGPPPQEILRRHPAVAAADPDAVTAYVAAVAGYLTRQALLPPPPGLPTLRAFQAALAEIARAWVATRTGWR